MYHRQTADDGSFYSTRTSTQAYIWYGQMWLPNNLTQFPLTNNYDPALLTGWGVRSSDWSLGASIQQQILPRASIEVAYSRRWYHGFTLTDNLVVQASDYTPFSITAPTLGTHLSDPGLSA